MYKHPFRLAAFLLFTFVPSPVLAQAAPSPNSPNSSIRTEQPTIGGAAGAYFYVYRTPSHIRHSSSSVFQEVRVAISEYLAGQHVEVRKVEEADSSALAEENLEITRIEGMPDVFQKARLAGASYVLTFLF